MKKFPEEIQFTIQIYQFHGLNFAKINYQNVHFRFLIGSIQLWNWLVMIFVRLGLTVLLSVSLKRTERKHFFQTAIPEHFYFALAIQFWVCSVLVFEIEHIYRYFISINKVESQLYGLSRVLVNHHHSHMSHLSNTKILHHTQLVTASMIWMNVYISIQIFRRISHFKNTSRNRRVRTCQFYMILAEKIVHFLKW